MEHKKVVRFLGVSLLLSMMMCTAAFATSGLSAFCLLPPNNTNRFGAGVGTKEAPGSSAYLYDAMVGGGYEVDARQWDDEIELAGPWTRDVSTTNNECYLVGKPKMYEGHTIKIEFSSDLLTFVDVVVDGRWDTN